MCGFKETECGAFYQWEHLHLSTHGESKQEEAKLLFTSWESQAQQGRHGGEQPEIYMYTFWNKVVCLPFRSVISGETAVL